MNKKYLSIFILFLLLLVPLVQAQTYIGLKRLTVGTQNTNWLSGWDYRIQIDLNSTEVDEALTDFPILVHLNDSCGENTFDATAVFDEVGSDENATAYTSSDGETQLYFEVEEWDDTGEEAWVWVKVPSVSNTSDTTTYLYYDSTQDGSAYNSPTDVWDTTDGWAGVWHMNDNSTSTILDSTSNDNDGDKLAANEPIEATGKIGKAQDFDGIDDTLTITDNDSLDVTHITAEAFVKVNDYTSERIILGKRYTAYELKTYSDRFTFETYVGGVNVWGKVNGVVPVTGSEYYLVWTYDGTTHHFYVNGVEKTIDFGTGSGVTGNLDTNAVDLNIGSRGAGLYWDDWIDEVRISNALRSSAWVAVSYETQRDSFNSLSSSVGIYDSTITVKSLEENDEVRLYNGTTSIVNATVDSSGEATLTLPVAYRTGTFTATFKVYDSDGDLLFLDEYTDAKGGDVYQSLETATTGGLLAAVFVGMLIFIPILAVLLFTFMKRRR